MKEFYKKMLLDYICGNEIEGYDINELENNPRFMAEVIKMTKEDLNIATWKKSISFIKWTQVTQRICNALPLCK